MSGTDPTSADSARTQSLLSERAGGGHQTERYCPCLGWPLVASPLLRHRTVYSLGHRHGENTATVIAGCWRTQDCATHPRSPKLHCCNSHLWMSNSASLKGEGAATVL